MNMQRFFEQIRETHAAKDVEIDPFAGMESLVFELSAAAASVLALTSSIEAARTLRQMQSMRVDSRELHERVKQLAIMAESLLRIAATHAERGVK